MTGATLSKSNSNLFQLVYEGPVDDSPRTLQKIKGVFVADLEFPIPQIQAILDSAPAIIKDAESESELSRPYQLLKKAGAKVLIIGPQSQAEEPEHNPQTDDLDPIKKLYGQPQTSTKETTGESDELTFELVVDGLETLSDPTEAKEQLTKVYSLDVDSPADTSFLAIDDQSPSLPTESPSDSPSETNAESPATSNPLISMLEADEAEAFLSKKETSSAKTTPHETTPLSLQDESGTPPNDVSAKDAECYNKPSQPQTSRLAEFETFALELEDTSPKAVSDSAPLNQDRPGTLIEDSLSTLPLDVEGTPPEEPSKSPENQHAPASSGTARSEIPLAGLTLESSLPNQPVFQPVTEPEPELAGQQDVFTGSAAEAELPQPTAPESEPLAEPSQEGRLAPKSNAPASSPRAGKKQRQLLEVLLPILLGSAILAVANWYYFSPAAELPLFPDLPSLEEETGVISAPASESTNKSKPAADTETWEGADSTQERELKVIFSMKHGHIVSASVNVATAPPAELTKEELVEGKKRAPWLRKVQAFDIPLKQTDNGEYTGQGAALAYIERSGEKWRLTGTVEVTARVLEDGQTISAFVAVKSKDLPATPGQPFKFESADSGSYVFYISSQLTAKQSEVGDK